MPNSLKEHGEMSVYKFYSPLTSKTIKDLKKVLDRRSRALSVEQQIAFLIDFDPNMLQTLDFQIFCEERHWRKKGRHCIFPRDAEVIDRLLSAEFEAGQLEALEMPFESFVIAMPNGYKIDGCQIPSCLITWGDFTRSGENVMTPFCDAAGLPRMEHSYPTATDGQKYVSIVYQDSESSKWSKMLYSRTTLTTNQFKPLLDTRDLDEFSRIAGNYEKSTFNSILANEPHDQIIQYNMLKLVLALAIYNQATDGENLKDGIPGPGTKLMGMSEGTRPISSTISMPPLPKRSQDSPNAHYRRWHFRQLMHERYYTKENAEKPRGSRWTFVKDAYVMGADDSAHTLDVEQE
jgi:hypothetical protein